MPYFSVFRLRHNYAGSHPNRTLKKDILTAKNGHVLLKNILFKLNFQDEGQLDSNFLIYILTFIVNAFFFSSQVVAYVWVFPS